MAINDDARECVEAAKPSESTDTKAAHDQVGSVLVPWATACEKGSYWQLAVVLLSTTAAAKVEANAISSSAADNA